ncbi:MAG: hypothetical protein IPG13_04685 [Rhodocyclaceae bacterium]|nr:hypothetical protein [Rhodocyclaceae bacterium]
MQAVLEAPVPARRLGEKLGGRHTLAADVEGALPGGRTVDFSPSLDHANTGQLGPVFPELLV